MGHVRLGVLLKSRKWSQVVGELRLGGGVEEIAALAAEAAETTLQAAANDPAFLHSFWLLTQVPLAARGPDFAEDLRRLGISDHTTPRPDNLRAVTIAEVAAITSIAKHDQKSLGLPSDYVRTLKWRQVEPRTRVCGG